MREVIRYISLLFLLFLFGCGGGGSTGNANFTMSLSSSSVVAGGSVSANAQLTSTTSSPVNNINVTFTSNRPDLIHFATDTGPSSITVKTNIDGSVNVVLYVDNSVAIPADGVDVSITSTSSGIPSTQPLKVTALSSGGATVGTTKISLALGATSIQDNSGQTIATATVTDSAGTALPGLPVSFTISPAAGPATISPINGGITDSSGKAYATISATTTSITKNIIIYAAVSGVTTTQPMTVVPTTSTTKLTLVTDLNKVDASGGQVVATATLVDSAGTPIPGVAVTFSILATGPASIISPASVNTSTSGTAKVTIQTTATDSTQNVLVQASTIYAGTTYTQVTAFQITKGIGTLVVTAPATTSSTAKAPATVSWITAIPVQLLDANGNPRTNIPVTLSILSSDRAGYQVATGVGTYAATATINTDAQGKVIFSTQSASLTVGAVGSFDTTQVVWKAQTNDVSPIIGYATSTYNLTGS